MDFFEYNITKHTYESYKELVIYCTEKGECSLDQVPDAQTMLFQNILNDFGKEGWELVQLAFGSSGIVAFWKRKIDKVN